MVFTDATQGLFFCRNFVVMGFHLRPYRGSDGHFTEGQGAEMPLLTHSQDSNGGGPASSHLL